MTLGAAELSGGKCFDQFPGECATDYEAPEADHVHIVIFDTLVCRKGFMNQAGPDLAIFFATTDAPTPLPQMATPRSTRTLAQLVSRP
jgi:hypothetical protein